MTKTDVDKRTLSINRTLNAPIDVVWEAWTNPQHIAQWWARGMKVDILEHEFKVGGNWKFGMKMPNGQDFFSEGTYLLIEEKSKIHSTADFKPMTENVEIRAEFEAAGHQTSFNFSVIHVSEEYKNQQEQMGFMKGWGGVFDKLAEFVQN
jgi:uncharacterized protein YndB with AHSA1/START domain